MVYKVFKKNDYLFFCRVGGQFQEISEITLDLTPDKDDALLLSDKYNFRISCNEIESISTINRGDIFIVRIEFIINSRKEKYIVHPIIEYDYLINFFSKLGILLIEK